LKNHFADPNMYLVRNVLLSKAGDRKVKFKHLFSV